MNTDELRQEITRRTGLPADLLTGGTSEEVLARAKVLLKYKQDSDAAAPKPTREGFAEWLKVQMGTDDEQPAPDAVLSDLDEAVRIAAGGYPEVQDTGAFDVTKLPDARDTREQFAEFMTEQLSFNHTNMHNGWPGKIVRL